ncbi:MAG: PHP domain-containing protein [Candidatus Omnitrophica bacterium]|nr:PHP domain-containing protein [Candidatus Omnitrophota bacterium]
MSRARRVLAVGCALAVSCGGCAVLTRIPAHLAERLEPPATPAWDDGYEDYTGAMHIHTTYSHDAHGLFEDVVRVANAQGLDFVMLTEHNTLQPLRDGKQGWHGATLVIVGMEISTKAGHYLAFNVTQEVDRYKLTAQEVIDEVNRQGGFGFIAHPYFKKHHWTNWDVTGFTGIEGYNLAHDTFDENWGRLAAWALAASPLSFYFSIVDRPYDPLRTWDDLIARHGRIVGIGSTDAHEVHLVGVTFAPYDVMFRMARTHVLIPGKPLTVEAVYDALRRGHAYFAMELLAEAKGFSFLAQRGSEVAGIMGDEVAWRPNLTLKIWLPTAAHLTLFKDGQATAWTTGQTWEVPVAEAGVYRVEAARHGKPWIVSNPIYVRAPQPTAQE